MKNGFFLLLIAVFFFMKGFTQNVNLDFPKISDSLKIVKLIEKSNINLTKNLDSAFFYLQEAKKIERLEPNVFLNCSIKTNIGVVYSFKGILDSAIYFEREALNIAKKNKFLKKESELYSNLGLIYYQKGNNEIALKYFFKALKYFKTQHNFKSLTIISNNIGLIYQNQKRYDEAILFHKKNVLLLKKYDTAPNLAPDYLNISSNYLKLQELDSSYHYAQLSNNIYRKVKDNYGIAITENILGAIYNEKKKPFKAKEKYEQAIKLFNSIDSTLTIQPYRDLGNLFYEKFNNTVKAEENYLRAEKLAVSINDVRNLDYLYLSLGNVYFKSKKYKLSAKFLKKRIQIHDSLYTIERDEKVNKLIAKFEDREKQQKIDLLEKENETKKQKLKLRNVIIIALLLSLFIIGTLFYLFNQKQEQEIERKENQLQKYLFIINKNNKSEYDINSKDFANKYNLTNREIEILIFLKNGLSYSAIGNKLFISKNTVKYHIKNIYFKLDVKSKIQALNKINQ